MKFFKEIKGPLSEVSLGDYRKKAGMQKAQSQMGAMFGKPEEREKNLATFKKREAGLNRLKARDEASRKAAQEQQLADNIARLPELNAEYEAMKAKYKSLGGSNWQYADREQNLSDSERAARAMEGPMNNLWRTINAAEKAQKATGVTEDSTFGNYYNENIASKVFSQRSDLTSEDEVLNAAWEHVVRDMGPKKARHLFNYDEDFPSDLVSSYFHLQKQKQGVAEGSTSHTELAKLAYDAYVAATRKGNGTMAAHYLKQHQKHKADAAKAKSGVAEASIPYALSAANYNAEFERQNKNRTSSMPAGGGYRGRVELDVESREDYIATGKTLAKAAAAAGQHIEYGLSGGVMKVFSDSMTSDELDAFIDDTLEQGVAEGFKNTYNVGDRVDGPLGTGTIVAVSKNINVDGQVKVKLDDPSLAGADGQDRDIFVLHTTQLKHIADEASLTQMRDYFSQDDSDSVQVNRNYEAPSQKQNPPGIPQEIQTLVNKMYHAGKITPKEFEILRKFQQQTKINVGIKEADMSTGNQGYDSMLAVMKAVDAGHDAAFNLGGEPITLDYNEARFLAGKYKAFLKAGRQEEFLKYMESPVAFDRLMKQLRDLMDKQRNFRGSVQGERGIEEAAPAGAEQMTPNWAKYVLDQIYNSNGDVTLTDLFDEGIPGLHAMFMATAEEHGLNTDDEFQDVEHEVILKLEDIIKGGRGLDEGVVDAVKAGVKKVVKAVTGPDDEELLQRLEKETGGKRPEKKDSLPAVKESEYWCKIDRTAKLIPEGYKKLSSGYITRILG